MTSEGCASIADAAGNLLFYTDGIIVWNRTHTVMVNGSGMTGHPSTTQAALIVKQPGNSNIYFVFTLGAAGQGTLCYSIVDMNQAAGDGAVITKNVLLATDMSEKLTAVKHCNGIDVWVVAHDYYTNIFRCYLVTAAGVNMTPVITAYGSALSGSGYAGAMKVSPTGRKIAMAVHGTGAFEVYDFDNATGVVSNFQNLASPANSTSAYGFEFSPDGSKLYGTRENGLNGFYQWDLCAGSPSAVAASMYTGTASGQLMGMQLGPDGKIYVARLSQTFLGVINNPNVAGAGCNFVNGGQSIAPRTSFNGLPNFVTSFFKPAPLPFTFSLNCGVGSFTAPVSGSTVNMGCSALSFSATGYSWTFGDPSSGSSNNSTLSNPSHTYSAPGTYTAQLVIYNACVPDTIRLPVIVPTAPPSLSISGNSNLLCLGESRTYTVSGADTYTWSTGANGNTVTVNPSVTGIYSVSGTNTLGNCTATKNFTIAVSKCSGISTNSAWIDHIEIYPNPVQNIVTIEVSGKMEIYLMDHLGKLILSKTLEPGVQNLDLSSCDAGIYILKAKDHNGAFRALRLIKTSQD